MRHRRCGLSGFIGRSRLSWLPAARGAEESRPWRDFIDGDMLGLDSWCVCIESRGRGRFVSSRQALRITEAHRRRAVMSDTVNFKSRVIVGRVLICGAPLLLLRQEPSHIHLVDPDRLVKPSDHIDVELVPLPLLLRLLMGSGRSRAVRSVSRRGDQGTRLGSRVAWIAFEPVVVLSDEGVPGDLIRAERKRMQNAVEGFLLLFCCLDILSSFSRPRVGLDHVLEPFFEEVAADDDGHD